MVLKQIITIEQSKVIDIDKIYLFTKSYLWSRIKSSKKAYKEKPFYINISAKELYPEIKDEKEKILVQGIIDLYFIDENENIVLVDYKTDFVKHGEEELINKYKKQLDLYRYAIEESLGNKVHEVYIYSTYLNKEIQI